MSSTTFVDQSTPIVAAWLNDVNTSVYTTVPAVQTALSSLTASVQDSSLITLTSVSGTNTITASLTGLTAYGVGKTFRFVSAGANTGAVTININGLGAKAITKDGSTALSAGDIPTGAVVQITYDGTQFQLVSGAGGGAKAGGVFYENSTTLTSNYTITSGKNAMMVGPLNVATGVTLSIPTGSRLVVL